MHRRSFSLLFLFLAVPSFALVDFYGYRSTFSKKDSTARYDQVLLGYSELEISEITVMPRGTYLDVTEDAWISSDVTKLNISGLTGDYLYKGTIPVPRNATVTGLQTWRGEQCYRAVLRKSEYIADTRYPDSVSLQQSLDGRIALLQQHTESTFQITLARAALGEKIHVRIRYLLRPESTDTTGHFFLPVLFHTTHGKCPKFINFTVYANDDDQLFKVIGSGGSYIIDDTTTNMLPYESVLSLQHTSPGPSAMNLTEFSSESYSGNYLAVNTRVSDSVVIRLSKPISTVFIWRWNGPEPMLVFQNDLKSLSSYALEVIAQAEMIRETVTELHRLGNSCALIHSVDGENGYRFESEKINSASDSSLADYLLSINQSNLYNTYRDDPVTEQPGWVVNVSDKSAIQENRDQFVSAISDARALLRKATESDYRHIVVLSVGDVLSSGLADLSEELSLDSDSISIDLGQAQWGGVDLYSIVERTGLYWWSNFTFPPFSPTTIQLTLENAEQPFSFPLSPDEWYRALTFTARTAAAWDTTLVWTGFDEEGERTASITERPRVYRIHADSGLAKVWADDHSHIAEKEEIYPGGTFGILTKATYLQASAEDISDDITESVPFLSDEEIHAPKYAAVKKRSAATVKTTQVQCIRGVLTIHTDRSFSSLKIFDIRGKLLLSLDLNRYRGRKGAFIIPLSRLLRNYRSQMLLLQLSGKGCRELFNMINGRIQ